VIGVEAALAGLDYSALIVTTKTRKFSNL